MHNSHKKNYFINSLGLVSIGTICLGYLLFGRPFAEMHIQFSFLDFPIFIGEILIFLCLCLFFIKDGDYSSKINQRQIWIIVYFVFIIAKTLYGYSQLGPLALRHAALFYYPIFIVFGYSFYQKDFFGMKKKAFISLLIILIFFMRAYNDYWTLGCFILGFILVYSLRINWLKYILLASLMVVMPYKFLFYTSRTMMMGNSIALIYILFSIYFILNINKKLKIAIFSLCAFLVVGGAVKFMDRNAAKSIVSFGQTKEEFISLDKEIGKTLDRYEAAHSKEFQSVKLYRPNRPLFARPDSAMRAIVQVSDQKTASSSDTLKFPDQQAVSSPDALKSLNQQTASSSDTLKSPDQQAVSSPTALQYAYQEITAKLYNPEARPTFQTREDRGNDGSDSLVKEIDSIEKIPETRDFDVAIVNILFRLFIWRDMLVELIEEKPILGFDFGKPLRSVSLEALNWGAGEWRRDGWIDAHNSYLDMIYRAGIFGLLTILAFFIVLIAMIGKSVQCRSFIGVLLCGIIINWFVAVNFLPILELPYTAIPIWALFGLTYAYVEALRPTMPTANLGKGNEGC